MHSVNVKLARSEQKMLLTGMHTISNISCKGCDAPIGWVYIKANDPAQKYKEGERRRSIWAMSTDALSCVVITGKYIMEKVR